MLKVVFINFEKENDSLKHVTCTSLTSHRGFPGESEGRREGGEQKLNAFENLFFVLYLIKIINLI